MSPTFRLAVVLRLREMAEDQARAHLATALAGHRTALDRYTELQGLEGAARERLAGIETAGSVAGDIVAGIRAVDQAEQATATGRQALEAASKVLVDARAALAEASKRREVVERLRDRIHKSEILEAQRVEDATLSELAGVRHARGLTAERES